MFTKADSDATYCSEVEDMLKACSIPLNKSSNNLPLRRSQRLSQKLKSASEKIKNIAPEPVPAWTGVPLDLSHKSKESILETSRLEIVEHITTKNVLQVAKMNKEVARPQTLYKNKAQRPRISSCNFYRNKVIKKEAPKTQRNAKDNSYPNQSQQQHNHFSAKGIPKTLKKPLKRQGINKNVCAKKVNSLKNIFPENNAFDLAIMPELDFVQNNKLEAKPLFSNECAANKVAHSKKRRPRKTNKKVFAKPPGHTVVSMDTTESLEEIKLSESLKNKPIEMNLFEKDSNARKPSKRSRNGKHKSGEIVSKSNTGSNKKQTVHHNHIKVSPQTNNKTPNFDAAFNTKDSSQTKIEENDNKSHKRQHIHTTSDEIKSNRVLGSQAAVVQKKLGGQITTNNNLKNEHNQIKTETLSQKFYEEGMHTNNCLQRIPPAIPNIVCCQFMENKFSTIEVKHETQDVKSFTKLSKETDHTQTILQPLQKAELATETCQNEVQTKHFILNKNCIKSFDKNQFLDKIRNARSYVDHLSVENNNLRKINTLGIPPSPAESSEELLKKSILYNAYPAHFKYQLPPEAILTRSLDPQPLPTPEDTISSELLESSSSSPSLPESLCELFKTKDIKDILNLKQTSYHLNSYHIQALALILNIQIEYLLKILDKVINTSPDLLKNIEKAMKTPFAPDNDLFSNSSNELWNSSNVVPNSQSPKQRKISCKTK